MVKKEQVSMAIFRPILMFFWEKMCIFHRGIPSFKKTIAYVSTVVEIIIEAFQKLRQGDLQDPFKQELERELSSFIDNEGDLQLALKKAYCSYMDAEAPSAWVAVAEKKLKADFGL